MCVSVALLEEVREWFLSVILSKKRNIDLFDEDSYPE